MRLMVTSVIERRVRCRTSFDEGIVVKVDWWCTGGGGGAGVQLLYR